MKYVINIIILISFIVKFIRATLKQLFMSIFKVKQFENIIGASGFLPSSYRSYLSTVKVD